MGLAHFRMLIHELLNKNPNIFPKESPLIVLHIEYSDCMDNNGKYTKHTTHIARRIHLIRTGEN